MNSHSMLARAGHIVATRLEATLLVYSDVYFSVHILPHVAMHSAVLNIVGCLSVRLSVRHSRVFY